MARIAFFLPDFGGGGAEQVALTLMEGLRLRGHQLDLVLCRAEGQLLAKLPDDIRVVDLGSSRFRKALMPLMRYLREVRPAAVQASMWPLTSMAIMATQFARVGNRVVVSEHSALSRAYAGHGHFHRAFLAASIRWLYPLASARVAVSDGVRRDLAGFGVPPEMVDVVYNPVRASSHPPGSPFAWPAPGKKILSVANLVPAKNQLLLLEAFADVAKEMAAGLVICGEGRVRDALMTRAAELSIADRLSLPGFVEDIGRAYADADLFVLSSDWEGYPLVLVEALQAGLPVVATDCDFGPREILDDGRYGHLVPVGSKREFAQAMLEALSTTVNASAQRERAQQLSGNSLIDRYETLLLGEGPTQ